MKTWFHRLLLSYLPIFLVIVSLIIIISFLAVRDFSQKEAEKANRLFLGYVQQTIEHSLKDIDSTVIKGILTDNRMIQFFYPTPGTNRYEVNSQASEKIRSLMDSNQIIDSIYFVRLSDHTVLSKNALMFLEDFGDQGYITSLLSSQNIPQDWSTKRNFHEFFDQPSDTVVTMVKKVPILSGGDGFVVVNVGIGLIKKSLDDIYKSNISLLNVTDKDGNRLFGADAFKGLDSTAGIRLPGIRSNFTGWEFQSGIGTNIIYNVFSVFSYIWIVLMLLSVISGALWIVLVSRKNYKPIETILGRIQHYSKQKSLELVGKKGIDEFNFIGTALDRLIEQYNDDFQKQNEYNINYQKKFIIYEMLHDSGEINIEWITQMKSMGLPEIAGRWNMIVFEMDKYAKFITQYSRRDQQLLKFVLSSVIKEIADQHHVFVWTEWVSGHQLVALYQWPSINQVAASDLYEHVRMWVEGNLDFTITVGVGNATTQVAEIRQCYEEAMEALKYKSSLGSNRVIELQTVWAMSSSVETSQHVQMIRSLAQSFRLREEDWIGKLNRLFDDLSSSFSSRGDIVSLMNYMMYHIFREISNFSAEVQDIWTKYALPQMNDLLIRFDTIEDLREGCFILFSEALGKINALRDHRGNHHLIQEVKAYVEEHFANPDLSLVHLGEAFQISAKYVSQLFKEEFGEKFSDYLAKVRVEKAKRLLLDTDIPVQDISIKVGYLHTFSFIRMFKKLTGVTPGDYRKESRSVKNS